MNMQQVLHRTHLLCCCCRAPSLLRLLAFLLLPAWPRLPPSPAAAAAGISRASC
jgi:hypothetical protein